MDMPTKEKTIGDHKIIYKDYMTRMDRLNIQESTAGQINRKEENGAISKEVGVKMTYVEGEIATIKSVLIRVDDREGDAMARYVLGMPENESNPIFDLINEVTEKKEEETKKK